MSHEESPPNPPQPPGPRFLLLERVTAAVLLLVVVALGWVLLKGTQPAPEGGVAEAQVVAVLALLASALVLVSVVAFLHTR